MCEFHIYSFQFIVCTPAYIFSARYNKLQQQQYQTLTVATVAQKTSAFTEIFKCSIAQVYCTLYIADGKQTKM